MVLIFGDGKSIPISVDAKVLAVYDPNGVLIFGAEQMRDNFIQMGTLDDPDLKDIVLRNGLPFYPVKDVTDKFPSVNKGRVLSVK